MELKSLIELALQQNAHEILIEPNGKPRCRRDRDWLALELGAETEVNSSLTRKWAFEILPESGRQKLMENKSINGFWDISGQKLYYEVINSQSGFVINLQWMPQEWKNSGFWQWPPWIGESMAKAGGLGLVLGPKFVAREAAVESLLRLADQSRSLWTAWMRPSGFMSNGLESGVMTFLSTPNSSPDQRSEVTSIPSSCDIVVIDDPSQIEMALNLSQEGKFVIFACAGTRIEAFLQSRVPAAKVELFWSQLKWGLNLRTIWGKDSWLPAYDLIFNSEALRARWTGQTNKTLEDILTDSDRELGMRTINQTLIQGLMRRQLDFKRSFELSPEPDRLDEQLKTLGF